MRIFLLAFAGRIAATVFIAACISLGFGPSEWIMFITGHLEDPMFARAIFVLLGLITFVFLGWHWRITNQARRSAATADLAASIKYESQVAELSASLPLKTARDALETFVREKFDNVYFSIARCLLNINATASWHEYNSGKIAQEEHATMMMRTKPSVRLARTRNLTEAQLEFIDVLSDYGDTASSIHILPMLGSHELLSFNEYIKWRREDMEFIGKLREFIARPGYTILHEKINVEWGSKVRDTEWPRING